MRENPPIASISPEIVFAVKNGDEECIRALDQLINHGWKLVLGSSALEDLPRSIFLFDDASHRIVTTMLGEKTRNFQFEVVEGDLNGSPLLKPLKKNILLNESLDAGASLLVTCRPLLLKEKLIILEGASLQILSPAVVPEFLNSSRLAAP